MQADQDARANGDKRDLKMATWVYANMFALEQQVVFDHRVENLPAPAPPKEWLDEAWAYKRGASAGQVSRAKPQVNTMTSEEASKFFDDV